MGVSILFYSVCAALGSLVTSQEQMLAMRFFVGLGVGGMWPNGIALVAESWPTASKATVSGVMAAGLNAGILMLAQLAGRHAGLVGSRFGAGEFRRCPARRLARPPRQLSAHQR
jgi:MFS family permease